MQIPPWNTVSSSAAPKINSVVRVSKKLPKTLFLEFGEKKKNKSFFLFFFFFPFYNWVLLKLEIAAVILHSTIA